MQRLSSLHVYSNREANPSFDPGDEPNLYACWAASVIGPVVHVLAVIYALLWGYPSSVVGSIVSTPYDMNCYKFSLYYNNYSYFIF